MWSKLRRASVLLCTLAWLLIGCASETPVPTDGAAAAKTACADTAQSAAVRRQLHLACEALGDNAYYLSWNECPGVEYAVQRLEDGQWQTVERIAWETGRFHQTGHLEPFREYTYRVVAVGNRPEQDVTSQSVTVTTAASAVYSTVWPVRELEVYTDTACTELLGKASAATAYCVLEERDGFFAVRFGTEIGYLDSRWCMINLPEYMGSLCAYDITNSYQAAYTVHGSEIPQVTGTVVTGYEQVQLATGEYLVPLLYPTAQKLTAAALTARSLGYQLKIYDSYRPRQATKAIYDLTSASLQTPISQEQTYEMCMTDNGRYGLYHFLARGYSNHNLGVALDLTLVELATGEPVQMQSQLHDLSWYSELAQNNAGARQLQQIMVAAGFATLESEWWHFQDDDARQSLNLTALEPGISPQCWMRTDTGWRYRCADGTYYANCTETLEGITWVFNADGYAEEAEIWEND